MNMTFYRPVHLFFALALFAIVPCVVAEQQEILNRPFVEINVGKDSSVSEFSSDGRLVATYDYRGAGGSKTVATIWNTATGKKVFDLKGGGARFSPDGRFILVGYQDWDTQKYQQRWQREKRKGNLPKGAVPGSYMWLKVHDAKTGRELYELEMDNCSWNFSDDGKSIMFDGFLWNLANGRRLRKLNADEQKSLEFNMDYNNDNEIKHASPDGQWICTELKDEKRLLFQDKESGKVFYLREKAVEPLWSPDSRYLLHRFPEGDFGITDTIRIYDFKKSDR